MIGLTLVVLLAAPPAQPKPVKAVRPMTEAEGEAEAVRVWESTRGKEIPMPDAGAVIRPFRWKISNIIREVAIDGIQVANDVPVKLHGVVVKGRLADVLEELVTHFHNSGLYMEPLGKQDQPLRQTQVTALDHDRAISYTAMIDPLADGTCMIVLGEGNIGAAAATGTARKNKLLASQQDFAPIMPKAVAPTRSTTEGLRAISFSVSQTEAEVRSYYLEELKKLGYTEEEPNLFKRTTDQIQLTMRRDKARLDVLLTARLAEQP